MSAHRPFAPTTNTMAREGVDVGPHHLIGERQGSLPGPLTIISAGMHGNEPAGVHALRRILAGLQSAKLEIKGRFVALAGNLTALRCGLRYIDRDLNRQWDRQSLERMQSQGLRGYVEDIEQLELLQDFETLTRHHLGTVNLLDLHTMSASGVPFIVTCDTDESRALALELFLPGIVGLEKAIPGTTLEHFLAQGYRAVAVEGGQHSDPRAVDLLEAVGWRMLVATGTLIAEQVPDRAGKDQLLRAEAEGRPQHVVINYRHEISPEDGFEMLPGFHNLQPVRAGQLLARDRQGGVVAPHDGYILLPLYQKVGNDGFFIGS